MDKTKSNHQNDTNERRVKKLKDEEDAKKPKKETKDMFKEVKDAPEVLPVQDPDEEDTWGEDIHPHLPAVGGFGGGSLTLLIGAVKTGKSTLLSNLFLNDNFYGQDLFDYVKIMSNTISNDITSRYMKEAYDVDDEYDDAIIHGILENQKKYEKSEQPKIALICDDLLGSVFLMIYKYATPNRYDFLHMDLQSNPVKCYANFKTLIAEGQTLLFDAGGVDLSEFDESANSLKQKVKEGSAKQTQESKEDI